MSSFLSAAPYSNPYREASICPGLGLPAMPLSLHRQCSPRWVVGFSPDLHEDLSPDLECTSWNLRSSSA